MANWQGGCGEDPVPGGRLAIKTQTDLALQLPVTSPNLSFFIHKMGVRTACTRAALVRTTSENVCVSSTLPDRWKSLVNASCRSNNKQSLVSASYCVQSLTEKGLNTDTHPTHFIS